MKKKITFIMVTASMLLSSAIYARTFFVESEVDTNCEFTGDPEQSCRYSTGGTNYLVLNCVPNGNDCAFTLPPANP